MSYSSKAVGDLITKDLRMYAEKTYALQIKGKPDFAGKRSREFIDKSIRDTEYNLLYLSNAIKVSSPKLFVSYVTWFVDVLESINIHKRFLAENFNCMLSVFEAFFEPKDFQVVKSYIDLGIAVINGQQEIKPLKETPMDDMITYKDAYVKYLLNGNRQAAGALVQQLYKELHSLEKIYIEIFQQSQYEIGHLWQTNAISIAQEHYCTASTQLIMGQFYPEIFSTPKNKYIYVGACVGGELHELGVRMVSDFMELNGWNTYYLGANMPSKQIVEAAEKEKAHLLGLSVTMTYHLEQVVEIIEMVRKNSKLSHLKILVGGYPFLMDEQLWQRVGADGFSKNASEAVKLANQLMALED